MYLLLLRCEGLTSTYRSRLCRAGGKGRSRHRSHTPPLACVTTPLRIQRKMRNEYEMSGLSHTHNLHTQMILEVKGKDAVKIR